MSCTFAQGLNMCSLRFFSNDEVKKFKENIIHSKAKRKVAQRALTFATQYVFYTRNFPAYIHCSKFSIIGRVDGAAFPMWLKRNLFIEVDSTYFPAITGRGKNKGWIVNQEFYALLYSLLTDCKISGSVEDFTKKIAASEFVEQYKDELNAIKPLEYSSSENGRLYHPLQGVKRDLKKNIIFKDFNDFDISSAAPTILFQLYHNICKDNGIVYNRFNELGAIEDYISNKEEIRKEFAKKYDLEEDTAKKIINSFFNKSRLAASSYCIIFTKYLEFDVRKIEMMQQDEFVKYLKRDIDFLWNKIESIFNPEYKKRIGKNTKRWYFYFKEERKILDVIIEELTKITGELNLGYYLEHDGFLLHKKYLVDLDLLEQKIFEQTGYQLQIMEK